MSDNLDQLFEKLMLDELPDVVELINWDRLLERCKEGEGRLGA